jgi:hypothetical protein
VSGPLPAGQPGAIANLIAGLTATEISQQTNKDAVPREGTVASRVRSACIETDFMDAASPI